MQKTVYENYKYCIQDVSRIYIGCKYTFAELLEEEAIPFKFRMLAQKYILPEADLEDTLETHFYYLGPEGFLPKLYGQMKAGVKVNVLEEKGGLFGKGGKRYVTRQLDIAKLTAMPPADKEAAGLVIQELSVSKLALLGL